MTGRTGKSMGISNFEELGLMPLCRLLNFQLLNCYYGYKPGKWKSGLSHNRLIFIFESDGKSSFTDESGRLQLRKNMMVLIPAFDTIVHDQNDTMNHCSIHFGVNLCGGIDLMSQCKTLWSEPDSDLVAIARAMLESQDRIGMAAGVQALCWEAVRRILVNTPIEADKLLPRYVHYLPLFEYLIQNCRAGTDVNQMAQAMRMNRETFIKHFFNDTGYSPKHFFNRMLVMRASHLLSDTEKTIREISMELEFCNEFYFSRFFKRHLGISPKEYRKLYRIEEKKISPEKVF